MDFEYLVQLREHPTWKLLMADSGPLILSFFHNVFVRPGVRAYPQSDLAAKLDDYLIYIRAAAAPDAYPRGALDYLNEWAGERCAFLRKYYPDRGDEPEFDMTPASEKAIEWLRELAPRSFVGTESRLLTLIQLLRLIVQATEADPAVRLAELERQKQAIEAEMARLSKGQVDPYDPTRVKERYFEIEDAARSLLSDFRQVEENFRDLDRRTRDKITTSRLSKGRLLDEIFGEEDEISRSDQGKSFRAFWAFLMSRDRQEELQDLVQRLLALPEVRAAGTDELLPHLKFRLMEAGDKVKRMTAALVEQLRRYLDDKAWLENKRIIALIRVIEEEAVRLRENPPRGAAYTTLEDTAADIELPLARGLYAPTVENRILEILLAEGQGDFDPAALYQTTSVDLNVLRARIRRLLQERSQISLAEVCERFPLNKGLSELVAYIHIATQDSGAFADDQARQTVQWQDDRGRQKRATLPRVIFSR